METCKILGIRQINTSALHPISNGQVERFHKSLHNGLSHYNDSSNTNWNLLTPFYLMAYRATPNTTTVHSPYYLLHGREMPLPGVENLKPKLPNEGENLDQHCRLENLKASLRLAYETVKQANKKSYLKNKRLYDRKAKLRNFNVGDIVYLFNPSRKPKKCYKFHKFWTGPFKVTAKLSELNYEIA